MKKITKDWLIICAVFIAIMAGAIGIAGIAYAADLTASDAGDVFLDGTYVDQLDGNWFQGTDYKICTYSTTYAIITAYADTCGSGASQWYHNFGAPFDSTDIAALSPGDWTNNFFTDPAPLFVEGGGGGGGGGVASTTATSTIEQSQENLYHGYMLMFVAAFFGIFALTTNRK